MISCRQEVWLPATPVYSIEIEDSDTCENGGIMLSTYKDDVLQQQATVCNGVNGTNGQDGSSLWFETRGADESECENGGTILTVFSEEGSEDIPICDGEDAANFFHTNEDGPFCHDYIVIPHHTFFNELFNDAKIPAGFIFSGDHYYSFIRENLILQAPGIMGSPYMQAEHIDRIDIRLRRYLDTKYDTWVVVALTDADGVTHEMMPIRPGKEYMNISLYPDIKNITSIDVRVETNAPTEASRSYKKIVFDSFVVSGSEIICVE